MTERIDSHQHFWQLARGDYGWLTPAQGPLYRDFGPQHMEPLRLASGVSRTIVVQAAPTLAETHFLLGLAKRTGWVAGVVGWVDMAAPDAPDALAELARDPHLRGIRPMLQDIADPEWMLRAELEPCLHALVELGLCFDALVRPLHLPRLLRLLERHPELRVVVDHGAKPEIASGRFEAWASAVAAIAKGSGAYCKLSGLVTEAGTGWTSECLRPYMEHLLACFGAERLMWGSDWPVVELAGGYHAWHAESAAFAAKLEPLQREALLGGSAARFYRLDAAPPRGQEETR